MSAFPALPRGVILGAAASIASPSVGGGVAIDSSAGVSFSSSPAASKTSPAAANASPAAALNGFSSMRVEMRTPEQMKIESEKATREALSALGKQARSGALPSPHSDSESSETSTEDSGSSDSDASDDERRAARHRRNHHSSSRRRNSGGGSGGSATQRDLESRVHYLTVDLMSTRGELSDAQTALEAAMIPKAHYEALDASLNEYCKSFDAVVTARAAAAPRGMCACLRASTMTAADADAHGARLNKSAADARAAIARLPAGKIREYVTRVQVKNDKDAAKNVDTLHADATSAARWSCAREWVLYAVAAALGAVVMTFLMK